MTKAQFDATYRIIRMPFGFGLYDMEKMRFTKCINPDRAKVEQVRATIRQYCEA